MVMGKELSWSMYGDGLMEMRERHRHSDANKVMGYVVLPRYVRHVSPFTELLTIWKPKG